MPLVTPAEIDAFRRGVILAFISTTVRDSVHQSMKRNPEQAKFLQGVDENEVATRIIITTYRKINEPVPTMEEATLNVDTIRRVGNAMINVRYDQRDMFNPEHNNNSVKDGPQNENKLKKGYNKYENKRNGMFKMSLKDREELR